jgi:tetratricopeptide (TPR) repeat protein
MKRKAIYLLSAALMAVMVIAACAKSPAKNPEALIDEGVGLMKGHDYVRALEDFDKAAQANPNDAKAHFFRGNALSALGRKEEAILAFDRAISLAPDVPQPYFNKGNALATLGRNEDAIAAFGAAISKDPQYVKAYNNEALVLQRLGRTDEANAVLEKARAIDQGARQALPSATGSIR